MTSVITIDIIPRYLLYRIFARIQDPTGPGICFQYKQSAGPGTVYHIHMAVRSPDNRWIDRVWRIIRIIFAAAEPFFIDFINTAVCRAFLQQLVKIQIIVIPFGISLAVAVCTFF